MAKTPTTPRPADTAPHKGPKADTSSRRSPGLPQVQGEVHDDGLLESIGKAISSPVRGAAGEEPSRED